MYNRRFEVSRDLGPTPIVLPPDFHSRGRRQRPLDGGKKEEDPPSVTITPQPQFVTGLVSHMHKNEFGSVGGEIIFHHSVVDNGREVKVGDQVVVEVEPILSAGFPFKQNAKRVQVITRNTIPSPQQQGQQGQRVTRVTTVDEEKDRDRHYESPSLAQYREGMKPQTATNEEEFFSSGPRSEIQEPINHQRLIRKFPWEVDDKNNSSDPIINPPLLDHDNFIPHSATAPIQDEQMTYLPPFSQQGYNEFHNNPTPPPIFAPCSTSMSHPYPPLHSVDTRFAPQNQYQQLPQPPLPFVSFPTQNPPIETILRDPLGPADFDPALAFLPQPPILHQRKRKKTRSKGIKRKERGRQFMLHRVLQQVKSKEL